jgi:hypothetical protein
MDRLPQRRASAIQADAKTENGPERRPEAARPRIGLGWRLALLVWACGFAAIFGYELWNMLWKLGKGWFGGG